MLLRRHLQIVYRPCLAIIALSISDHISVLSSPLTLAQGSYPTSAVGRQLRALADGRHMDQAGAVPVHSQSRRDQAVAVEHTQDPSGGTVVVLPRV